MGELLGDGGVESGHGIFLFRHRFQLRGVAAAEIASMRGQRKKRQGDNEQPSQHRVFSTQGGRSRQLAGVAASLRDAATGADWQEWRACEARLH